MFINRQQSGLLLVQAIAKSIEKDKQFDIDKMVVFALPRGGIPVALEIALVLHRPLNIITSKKIGAPQQPELAVGAVTSDGVVIIDEQLKKYMNISTDYLDNERDYLAGKTKEMESVWRLSAGLKTPLDFKRKQAIVVDDGVATGMTAIAAARSLRDRGVERMIFATPVISLRAYSALCKEYDEIVALAIPDEFEAVGQFYVDFSQVGDAEVVSALTLANNRQMAHESVR